MNLNEQCLNEDDFGVNVLIKRAVRYQAYLIYNGFYQNI